MLHDLLQPIVEWYMATLADGGYGLIVLLMAMESSFIPLPSEVVIPPAAALAARTGQFSYGGLVAAGTLGSWIGAALMYWGARIAGRPLVLRYGKYFFVPPSKVIVAERWAVRYGSAGVFVARLVPVVRHLIGIPFGIVRMDFLKYSVYTVLGSGIWCAVLVWIGVTAGADPELMRGSVHRIALWVGGGALILGGLYYFFVHRAVRDEPATPPSETGQ